MEFLDEDIIDNSVGDTPPIPQSEITLTNSGPNDPPTLSDYNPNSDGNFSVGSTVQLLGSASTVARDLGTAAGQISAQVKGAPAAFQKGYNATATNNKLSTWWQYASTTDKMMIGLAVVAILVALKD